LHEDRVAELDHDFEPGNGGTVGNKDKGAAKANKKAPSQNIKEKRAAKKAKKAAASSRSSE